eukprot:583055-Alexandrium_andersonii.AAC.1
MSASLVGSEMCIRDRLSPEWLRACDHQCIASWSFRRRLRKASGEPPGWNQRTSSYRTGRSRALEISAAPESSGVGLQKQG